MKPTYDPGKSQLAVYSALRELGLSNKEIWLSGILPPIMGGAKGYNETADYITTTVDRYNLNEMWDEFQQTIQILNSMRQPIIDRIGYTVTTPVERVLQVVGDDFEEADEYGRPKSIRLGTPYNLGFDLKFWDLGIGYTYRFLSFSTAEQLRALNSAALDADQRLSMKTILSRVFDNTNTTTTLIDLQTVVNVYPFWNNDGVNAPPGWKTYTFDATHNHYLTSGNTAVVSTNIDSMVDTIHHHGYDQQAELILMCNRVEANRIRGFRITSSDRFDFLPKTGTSQYGTLIGSLPGDDSGLNVYPGFKGTYGDVNVVEEDYMPAGYMVMFASGGLRADRNPVGIREHDNESARGLKLFPGDRQDYPLVNSFYHHAMGAGVRHRGAGVVMQVTSGAYAIPSVVLGGPGGR